MNNHLNDTPNECVECHNLIENEKDKYHVKNTIYCYKCCLKKMIKTTNKKYKGNLCNCSDWNVPRNIMYVWWLDEFHSICADCGNGVIITDPEIIKEEKEKRKGIIYGKKEDIKNENIKIL